MAELIKQSILSGFLVGLGVIVNVSSSNQYVGAMLFSIALLVIIECNLKLYTGRIGYIKNIPIKDLMFMLLGNLVGVMIPIIIKYPLLHEQLLTISTIKFSKTYLEMLADGFMCGVLMFIAVHCKNYLITVFSIMTFILSGYEHCIANFPYLLMNFNAENFVKFMCLVLGNSVGSISTNRMITVKKKNKYAKS